MKIVFIISGLILIFIVIYRNTSGKNMSKYLSESLGPVYDKISPYSYKMIRQKIKEMGQDYTPQQYIAQIFLFATVAGVITFLYFYSIIISIIYAVLAVLVIPYLNYLRCKRIYSEFIFEQIQVYTTNTIMEFRTTQSFVKALEGVYNSGVLEDPVKSDVKVMIDMSYENGTINESLLYMESKYDFFIVRNMHQLFLQITNEGAKDSTESLENMSQDIDMLVESVYRDREERARFNKKFLVFGMVLYCMGILVQFLVGGRDTYLNMLELWYVQVLIHLILFINSFFLLKGEKYYNENVGAE